MELSFSHNGESDFCNENDKTSEGEARREVMKFVCYSAHVVAGYATSLLLRGQ